MKKLLCRITAFLLVLIMTFPQICTIASQKETEGYMDMVSINFEASFVKSDYFTELTSDGFYYKGWMNNMDNNSPEKQLIVWCANKLMGTNLTKDAYVTYLSSLLSMMQINLAEVSAKQAEYVKETNVAEEGASVAFELLFLNDKAKKAVGDVIDMCKSTVKLNDKISTADEQFAVLSMAVANYENQVKLLELISNNAKDKKLKDAAEEMLTVCATQCVYIAEEWKKDAIELVSAEAKLFAPKIMDAIAKHLNSGFNGWVRKTFDVKTAARVLKFSKVFLKVFSAVWTGIDIGSGVMKIAVGDKYEAFGEMSAMDRISDALTVAARGLKDAGLSGTRESRYESIEKYVLAMSALNYAHLRGEYCNVQSRDKKVREGVGRKYYEDTLCTKLDKYNLVINGILSNADFFAMADAVYEDDSKFIIRASYSSDDPVYGYVDARTGEMVIEPKFTEADNQFRFGVAIVSKNGETAVINTKGEYIFPHGSIVGAYAYYEGEYYVVRTDEAHCSLYKGMDKVCDFDIAAENIEKVMPSVAKRTGAYNRSVTYTPERFIPLMVYTTNKEEPTTYWFDNTGKLIYKDEYNYGGLAHDDTGYYFFGDGCANRLDDEGNVAETIEAQGGLGGYNVVPQVDYDGDSWYARFTESIYTNGMKPLAHAINMGYYGIDAKDGVLSTEGQYFLGDGTELEIGNFVSMPYFREGYYRDEDGFADKYGVIAYEYAKDEDAGKCSNIIGDGIFVYRTGSLCGLKKLDGTVILAPTYGRLFTQKS